MKSLASLFLFVLISLAPSAEPSGDGWITLYDIHFSAARTRARFRIPAAAVTAQQPWNPGDSVVPLDPHRAWSIAAPEFDKRLPGQQLVLAEATLENMRFLSDVRDTDLASENRWFYVVEAKPRDYRKGQPLLHPELYVIIVLLDGQIIVPEVSDDPPPKA